MTQTISTKDNQFNRKVYLLIFALVFLLYGNSIKNNYALDDNYVTVTTPEKPNNPRIEKGIKGIPKLFTTHYVESGFQSFEYRPLVLVTFAIEYQFFGSNPHISHFISVLLYAITCMLLFTILSKLLKNYNLIFPLLVVFLFIIHPIHTEVVDNIKCRDELLSFLFGICSLYYFLKNTEDEKLRFVLLGILFLGMGFLCKRTAMLFMAIIPLTIYFFTSVKLKKVMITGLVLFIAFFVYDSIKSRLIHGVPVHREFSFLENPLYYEHGFLTRIPLAFYTLGYYLKLLLIPHPLSCYYGYNTIPMPGWISFSFIVSAIFYLAISIYALIKLPQKSVLSYGILVYLGCIFPVANILIPATGIVAERFIYFASFGFCMAVAYLLLKLFKVDIKADSKFKTAQQSAKPLKDKTDVLIQNTSLSFKLTLTGILILFSYLTIARNTQWKDELTLFRNDIGNFQNSCNLHYILGNKLYNDEINITPNGAKRNELISECKLHYEQARELLKAGIQKYPKDFTSLNNIGMIYIKIFDDAPAAWPYFKRAMALNAKEEMIQFNMALCYEKRNQPDSAILGYEKMIAAKTTYLLVYLQLHELYLHKHEFLKAIAADEKGIAQIPNNAHLYTNLAYAYVLNKDTLNAMLQFKKAVEADPTNTTLRIQIENYVKSIGYTKGAEKSSEIK